MGAAQSPYGQTGHPVGHVGCCAVGVTQRGCCWTGPSMTQQSCPCVQHSAPQHVSALEHVLAFWQGGVVHLPCSHVGAESGHTLPQPPQLKGSSSLSTQASPQQIWPSVHTLEHVPASPPPPLSLESSSSSPHQ